MKKFGILLIAAIAAAGCQGANDYLYYYVKEKPVETQQEFTVKELVGNSKIDIVWVIDNSGSMGEEQQAVIDNTSLFIKEFTRNKWLNWKMGLVSTDEGEDPFLGFELNDEFNSKDPDAVKRFQSAVARLGTGGSATEKSYSVLRDKFNDYPNFLRSGASLALIFVTDEDEGGELADGSMPAASFLSELQKLKGNLLNTIVFGVLGTEDFGCSGTSWNFAGSRFEPIFKAIKGETYPICSTDFGKNLADLGKNIVKSVAYPKLLLSGRPKPETIEVSFKGEKLPGGSVESGGVWKYDYQVNALVFYNLDFAEDDELSQVVVHYSEDDGFDL